jgi:hypothetical protein
MLERLWRDQAGRVVDRLRDRRSRITVLVVVGIAVAGAWAQAMWTHLLPLLG